MSDFKPPDPKESALDAIVTGAPLNTPLDHVLHDADLYKLCESLRSSANLLAEIIQTEPMSEKTKEQMKSALVECAAVLGACISYPSMSAVPEIVAATADEWVAWVDNIASQLAASKS